MKEDASLEVFYCTECTVKCSSTVQADLSMAQVAKGKVMLWKDQAVLWIFAIS